MKNLLFESAIKNYSEHNYLIAFRTFLKLSNEKNLEAFYMLGLMYYKGLGVIQDIDKAIEYFLYAAYNGHIASQYNLGYLHYHGISQEMNYHEASKWFFMAATKGHVQSQKYLGFIYSANTLEEIYDQIEEREKEKEAIETEKQKWANKYFEEYDCYPEENYEQEAMYHEYHSIQSDHEAELIRMLQEHKGVEQDFIEAIKWFKKSVEISPDSITYKIIGEMYQKGKGVKSNSIEAEKWFRLAEQCNTSVVNPFDSYYPSIEENPEIDEDVQAALKWFYELAKNGDAQAEFNIGYYHYSGDYLFESNYSEAYKWFDLSAKKGNKDAKYYLAKMYKDGTGIDEDLNKSFLIFLELAIGGYSQAQYQVGEIYKDKKDYDSAKAWYSLSAKQNNKNAISALEYLDYKIEQEQELYEHEDHINQIIKAAEDGDISKQIQLGLMFEEGEEVVQDLKNSAKWYLKAAESGNADAQYKIGEFHFHGYGVEPNQKKAINWFYESAKNGNSDAQFFLGFMFSNAKVVAKNYSIAYALYTLSLQNGLEEALEKRRRLFSIMSKIETKEAETLLEDKNILFDTIKEKY